MEDARAREGTESGMIWYVPSSNATKKEDLLLSSATIVSLFWPSDHSSQSHPTWVVSLTIVSQLVGSHVRQEHGRSCSRQRIFLLSVNTETLHLFQLTT